MNQAFDEVLDFVTSSPKLQEILEFQHSPETLARVAYLRGTGEMDGLNENELFELKEFEKADYFMRQLKLRAQRRLEHADK